MSMNVVQTWNCSYCTFTNSNDVAKCTMCFQPKSTQNETFNKVSDYAMAKMLQQQFNDSDRELNIVSNTKNINNNNTNNNKSSKPKANANKTDDGESKQSDNKKVPKQNKKKVDKKMDINTFQNSINKLVAEHELLLLLQSNKLSAVEFVEKLGLFIIEGNKKYKTIETTFPKAGKNDTYNDNEQQVLVDFFEKTEKEKIGPDDQRILQLKLLSVTPEMIRSKRTIKTNYEKIAKCDNLSEMDDESGSNGDDEGNTKDLGSFVVNEGDPDYEDANIDINASLKEVFDSTKSPPTTPPKTKLKPQDKQSRNKPQRSSPSNDVPMTD